MVDSKAADIPRDLLFSLYAGSHLYGTNTANSDLDLRGVVWPLEDEVFGLQKFNQQDKISATEDIVFYSLPFYLHLLVNKGNPNVHEWLWAKSYLFRSPTGLELIMHRERWLSCKVYKCGLGYLNGQHRRMTHQAPTGDLGAKRKLLVEQYGFDTKNASHTVRIARELRELADTGMLNVNRLLIDAEELIDIKNGKLSLDQAQRLIDKEIVRTEEAIKRNTAQLRETPDIKFANQWLIEVMRQQY